MYYFAYGSNMNHKQMKKRYPNSKFIKRAFLEGYEFVYDGYSAILKGAVANIIKSPSDKVWGGLFEINEDDLKIWTIMKDILYLITEKKKKLKMKAEMFIKQ